MSLVAYGSSDESDSNDAEDATPVTVNPPNNVNNSSRSEAADDGGGGEISDEDEGIAYTSHHTVVSDRSIDTLLKGLPAPKEPGKGFINEADELEDEVKPKAAELQDAPKPPKKVKQTVKITIPALPDSDEEDGAPAKKKLKPAASTGRSGLTALLPPPMHAPRKESNRLLLPYTLGKKSKPATSAQKPSVKPALTDGPGSSLAKKLTQYESDSDGDDDSADTGGNFFSLDTPSDSASIGPSEKPTVSETSDSVNIPTVPLPPTNSTAVPTVPLPPTESKAVPTVPLPPTGLRSSMNLPAPQKQSESVQNKDSVAIGPQIDQNAPLTFKGGVSSRPKPYQEAVSASTSDTGTEDGGSSNMYYNMPYDGTCSYPEVTDNEALRHDEEFLRLQGKRQRGREEINIVDVNADDYTNPADITKYLTEETDHRSKQQKKEDQPTHAQKRKHQIQFLAFEAKERELELKNSWADNKMTKRQTQAKYGF